MSNVDDVIVVKPSNSLCVQEEAEEVPSEGDIDEDDEEVNGEDDGGDDDEDTQPHHQTQPLPLLGRNTTRLSPPDATSLPLLGRTTSLFPRQTGMDEIKIASWKWWIGDREWEA
ncbi:hypothetical protein P8452_13442 [Trifolium repens]|nr:hypothetical protein P8452_13442 [Trifolium repens]